MVAHCVRGIVRLVTVSLVVAVFIAVAGSPVARAVEPESESFERPDAGSAMQAAVALDQKVEDVSQRTVYGSVFAYPDGTWEAQVAPEPVQVQESDSGEWVEVDPTLVEEGGQVAPLATDSDLKLSSGVIRSSRR